MASVTAPIIASMIVLFVLAGLPYLQLNAHYWTTLPAFGYLSSAV